MKTRFRLFSLFLALVMTAALFSVYPYSQSFAEENGNLALGKPAYANRETKTANKINHKVNCEINK